MSRVRTRILAIRIVLGLIFAVLLTRIFLPASGAATILTITALLVGFAYIFEALHKGRSK